MPITSREPIDAFLQRFGCSPHWVVRAPGRVNLIGEHTDYNDGFVLPMAIDRAVWIALRPRSDDRVAVYSADYGQTGEFSVDRLVKEGSGWIEYFKGVAWVLQAVGYRLRGWEGIVQGDVPVGAGLSSSAALELAVARAFAAVAELPWNPVEMAKLGQRAENEWVGMRCGIMDQLVSAAGEAGHAILIDCRSLQIEPVPLPDSVAVVILDTGTRRGLVDSAYNQRRAECESAAEFFGVKALRDVDPDRFQQVSSQLEEPARRRALHVIMENERTLQAADAMRRGEIAALGVLMNKSHASLRDDYEVSSQALDTMVQIAVGHPACHGARMTGAGFGGCAVALVDASAAEEFAARTSAEYQTATGNTPAVYVCRASAGAETLPASGTDAGRD